jgi:hypothetical protein
VCVYLFGAVTMFHACIVDATLIVLPLIVEAYAFRFDRCTCTFHCWDGGGMDIRARPSGGCSIGHRMAAST